VTFGDLELHSLSDGTFRLDGGAMFGVVPKPLWERVAPADARNRIRMAMRPLLVRGIRLPPSRDARRRDLDGTPQGELGAESGQPDSPSTTLLIDAGCGDKLDAKAADIYAFDRARHLDHALAEAGLTAGDIDLVLASHLHFDHAGGFTARGSDGVVRPRFPHARYIVRAGEWDDATHPNERNRASYFEENLLPLRDAGVVTFIDEDCEVASGVRVRRTGGHTMHHQIVMIESAGKTAVFMADLVPTAAHVPLPWIMGYDLYPLDTLEFKRAFLREAVEREYLVFFEHDPEIAAGYLREKNGRIVVERVL
jgi:glyoxylase-like metal-dependent hydrolase (beta-lactamase superfamily II)